MPCRVLLCKKREMPRHGAARRPLSGSKISPGVAFLRASADRHGSSAEDSSASATYAIRPAVSSRAPARQQDFCRLAI